MTVARVLREPQKVAVATRKRVHRALDATQYKPNLIARALASQRTGVVGAIVPTLSNSLIADVMQGMTDALAGAEYQLMVGTSGFSAAREEDLVRSFLSRRVDGLYLTGTSHTAATVRLLRASNIPVVEGGNIPRRPIDLAVGVANFDAAAAVVTHLVDRYGTAVGFIGGSTIDNDRMRDRRRGFDSVLQHAGAIANSTHRLECAITMEGGRDAIGRMLSLDRRPRAVFCATDVIAAGAVLECVRRELNVPHAIAIAGFDDLDIASHLVPALTTVRIPRYEIGQRAALLIHQCLSGVRPKETVVDLGIELIVRESA